MVYEVFQGMISITFNTQDTALNYMPLVFLYRTCETKIT